ncbi:EF-hand calcium binding domain 6 [Phyllostomus discolor]|uniref:EF-hand calcium binding domain 6 n=1 Tax=Phyllostomus discolor TaxID=89673 RepID=A0A834EIS4_9CHIR|nr:EF-hand calcium binding domain 6 [Phyllostomus discolor]
MVALMKLLPRIHKSRNVCLEGDEPQQNECQHHQVGQHQGQIPLTSSGAVPYLEFLSRFGGIDPNANVIKRDSRHEVRGCRTLKELELQVGEKILKNIKAVISALKLIDVGKTGLVQPQGLRRVLETFCLRMSEDEYRAFAQHYSLDKDAAVDYNAFLKNLSINNNLNLKYRMGNQEMSWENQQVKNSRRDYLFSSDLPESTWEDYSLDEIGRAFCQEFSKSREKIEKALSAGDPSQCGYISLNYLKIVLDTFVRRLPRRVFIQLMKRFGLRTTKKINWKQFLALLHDPPWTDGSPAAPPARRASTDSKSQLRKESVIRKLFGHGDHHTSLKKALLVINSVRPWSPSRAGRVVPEEASAWVRARAAGRLCVCPRLRLAGVFLWAPAACRELCRVLRRPGRGL